MNPNNQQPNFTQNQNGFYTPNPQNNQQSSGYIPGPQKPSLNPDNLNTTSNQQNQDVQPNVLAEWTASEFLEHNKNSSWFVFLAIGSVVLAVIVYFLTRQIMSVIATLMLTIIIAMYANAKPKTMQYKIDVRGIYIDNKHYLFSEFKSFSVIESSSSPIPYLQLLPIKKLALPITIFVHPQNSQAISEIIGQFLPYDQKKQDIADKLSSKIRF